MLGKARGAVLDWYKEHGTTDIKYEDVYTVWFCYILGGWKALVSTTIPDQRYFEVTYNKERNEIYLDAYKKEENKVISCK